MAQPVEEQSLENDDHDVQAAEAQGDLTPPTPVENVQ